MLKVKDTLRSTVHLSFDGRVIKTYHGPDATLRFETEVKMLKFLEAQGCPFVPHSMASPPRARCFRLALVACLVHCLACWTCLAPPALHSCCLVHGIVGPRARFASEPFVSFVV